MHCSNVENFLSHAPATKHSTTFTNLLYRALNALIFRALLLRQHAYLYDVGHFAAGRRGLFFGVLAFVGGLNVLGIGDLLHVLAAEAEVYARADYDEGGQGEKDDHRHYFRVEAALVVHVGLVVVVFRFRVVCDVILGSGGCLIFDQWSHAVQVLVHLYFSVFDHLILESIKKLGKQNSINYK